MKIKNLNLIPFGFNIENFLNSENYKFSDYLFLIKREKNKYE
jgi:hypothetical protein